MTAAGASGHARICLPKEYGDIINHFVRPRALITFLFHTTEPPLHFCKVIEHATTTKPEKKCKFYTVIAKDLFFLSFRFLFSYLSLFSLSVLSLFSLSLSLSVLSLSQRFAPCSPPLLEAAAGGGERTGAGGREEGEEEEGGFEGLREGLEEGGREETTVLLLLGLSSSAPENEMLLLPGTSLAKSAAASAPDAISAAHWAPEALSTNPSVSSFFASKASPTPPAAARKLCQKPNGSSAVAKKVEVIVKEMSLRLEAARKVRAGVR